MSVSLLHFLYNFLHNENKAIHFKKEIYNHLSFSDWINSVCSCSDTWTAWYCLRQTNKSSVVYNWSCKVSFSSELFKTKIRPYSLVFIIPSLKWTELSYVCAQTLMFFPVHVTPLLSINSNVTSVNYIKADNYPFVVNSCHFVFFHSAFNLFFL